MKKCLFALFVFSLFLPKVFAGEIIQTKAFSVENVSIQSAEGYDILDYIGIPASTFLGKPRLPRVGQAILLPSGSVATSVEIINMEEVELMGDFNIPPAQKAIQLPMPGKSFPLVPVDPDIKTYSLNQFYPTSIIGLVSCGSMCGYTLAQLEIFPVRYNPVTRKAKLVKSITYKLVYNESLTSSTFSTVRQREIFGEILERLVSNPEKIQYYAPKVTAPQMSKTLPSGQYQYVTISGKSEFDTVFTRLARWKTMKGVRDTVIPVSWISSNYTGYDLPEKIRNFIIDAKNTWGAVFILLGGQGDDLNSSEDLIPFRHAYYISIDGGHTDYIPTDLYYSDLDGSWDANGNHIYGELGDNVNMYPDVFVGRAPVKTIAQAQNFVNKILKYEQSPASGYLKKMLLPTAILWSSYEERPIQRAIANMTFSGWSDDSLFERNGTLSNSVMVSSMNDGRGMGHWVGHGNETGIYYGYGAYYSSSDADIASNGDKQGIAISIACMTGGVDLVSGGDCFAEHIINRTGGGCAGVMMNSRYGWGAYVSGVGYVVGPSEMIDTSFFHGIFSNGLSHQGQALASAKSSWVPYADSFNQYDMMRWCLYELNLFGDPEMMLWTDTPGNMQVTYNSIIAIGSSNYSVVVKDQITSNPINQALVCVMTKSGDCYEYGYTDATGTIVLMPSPGIVGDSLVITVTKQNYLPFQGTAIVISPSGPYVVYDDSQIDDDATGGSIGNNDGTVDPGETIESMIAIKNVGQDTALTVTAILRTSDSYVSITDSTMSYGTIPPDSSVSSGNYLWSIDAACPNNHSVLFSLFVSDGDTTWESFFTVSVPEPILKVISHSIDDDNSGGSSGNGDGIVNRGEIIEIRPQLVNLGTVLSPSASAIMRSTDPYLTILDSIAGFGDIASGDTAVCAIPFRFTVSTSAPREYWTTLYFEISDANPNAKSWQDSVRVRVWDVGQVMLVTKESSWNNYFTAALDSLGYSYDFFTGCSDTSVLNRYWTVILSTGITGTITSTEQTALSQYLDKGGRLFVTGQDIGFSIGGSSFYGNYLHAVFNTDDPYVRTLTGTSADPIGDSLALSISGGDGASNQYFPDGIAPTADGITVFSYDGTSYKGGVRYEGDYKTVYLSFGYEAISTQANRKLVMKRILEWFKGGPNITGIIVLPQYQTPSGIVNIKARATDTDTVFSMNAFIESPDESVVDSILLYDDGIHNDGAAGDNIYGNNWTTPITPARYLVDIAGIDKVGDTTFVNNGTWFSTNAPPSIEVSPDSLGVSLFVDDSTTRVLKIKNNGGDTLYFDISEQQRTLLINKYSQIVSRISKKQDFKNDSVGYSIGGQKCPADKDFTAQRSNKPFFSLSETVKNEKHVPFTLLTSPYATVSPEIDGEFGTNEWNDAVSVQATTYNNPSGAVRGKVYVKNNADTMFVLVDYYTATGGNSEYITGTVFFDLNNDGSSDGYIDTEIMGGIVNNYWGYSVDMGYSNTASPNNSTPHWIIEFAIPFSGLGINITNVIGAHFVLYDYNNYGGEWENTTSNSDWYYAASWADLAFTNDPVMWLSESVKEGILAGNDSVLVNIGFISRNLVPGTTYSAWLKISSNDPIDSLVSVPTSLSVLRRPYSVRMDPSEQEGICWEGDTVAYFVDIINEGTNSDIYNLITANYTWPVSVWDSAGTTEISTIGPIPSLGSRRFRVKVTVPGGVNSGDLDSARVYALSQADTTAKASAKTVTTARIMYSIPFSDGFEQGISKWVTSGTNNWQVRTGTGMYGTGGTYEGDSVMLMTCYNGGTFSTSYADVYLKLAGETNVVADFYWRTWDLYSGEGIWLDIYDGTWHLAVDSITGADPGWQHIRRFLTGYNMIDGFIFRFRANMDYIESADAAYLDKVNVYSVQYGNVAGTVKDKATNMPIANALVKINNINRQDTTDASGAYAINSIEIGTYQVECSASGYKAETSEAIIAANSTSSVDFLMGKPQLTLSGDSLGVTLNVGDSIIVPLCLKNIGNESMEYRLVESMTTPALAALQIPADRKVACSERKKDEEDFPAKNNSGKSEDPSLAGTYSGSYLSFGLSNYGEIMPFQYPVGTEHLNIGTAYSGYTICYNDGSEKACYAAYYYRSGINTVSYTVKQNDTRLVIVEVVTRTSDGKIEIKQEFTFDKSDKYVRIKPTVKNISGSAIMLVDFKLYADWDVDGDSYDDIWTYDNSYFMPWARDAKYVTIANEIAPAYRDLYGFNDYYGRYTYLDVINGPYTGDGMGIMHYLLGDINSGSSVSLNFVYAAADSFKELQDVVRRGLTDVTWLSENPFYGQIAEGDSSVINVKFNAKGLLGNTQYKAWLLVQTDDPVNPQSAVTAVLKTNPTGVEGQPELPILPTIFALQQCFPNPFNKCTTIKYQIPVIYHNESSPAKTQSSNNTVRCQVDIYNISGQLVKRLVDENVGPGYYQAVWDGRDNSGRKISSGIYFYRIRAGEFVDTKKMTLMR
jgi:hypothetical protein